MPSRSPTDATDILLINLSNPPAESIYPYAFVQFRAWARHYGVRVQTLEMSYVTRAEVRQWLVAHIERTKPAHLMFLLRQTDTQRVEDYARTFPGTNLSAADCFPIDVLAAAVDLARTVCNCPIGVIGRGFATAPRDLASLLNVDFGVLGNGDSFLRDYTAFCNGHADKLPNLVLRSAGNYVVGPREFSAPAPFAEYDPDQIDDVVAHYGRIFCFGRENLRYHRRGLPFSLGLDVSPPSLLLPRRHVPTVPMEVVRGYPFNCSFSAEAALSGDSVRYRDLHALENDLRALVDAGFRRFWCAAPVLNPGDTRYLRALARLFETVNRELGQHRLTWGGFLQPQGLRREDLALLYSSGFTSSALETPSLDDEHLRAIGVPYRSADLIAFHRHDAAIRAEHGIGERLPFCLALGTPHWTPATLARTLQAFHEADLAAVCDGTVVVPGKRVFAASARHYDEQHLQSFGPAGARPRDLAQPTFCVPPQLVIDGDYDGAYTLLQRLVNSAMTRSNPAMRDWSTFLARHCTPTQLHTWLQDLVNTPFWRDEAPAFAETNGIAAGRLSALENAAADLKKCRALIMPRPAQVDAARQTAYALILLLTHDGRSRQKPLLNLLFELSPDAEPNRETTPYVMLCRLNHRFFDAQALTDAVCHAADLAPDSLDLMLLQAFLFGRGVFVDARLRPLLQREPTPV